MKLKAKSKIIILLNIGILFALLPVITINLSIFMANSNKSSDYSDDSNLNNENLKISAVSGKIYIINNSGWVAFKSAGNCTGNGTYSEPYVIEDLVIDGGGSGSCISIINSDVFFRIENCTVYNSGSKYPSGTAGIRLGNVDNGQLINNTVNNNIWYGIYLGSSNNNTISGNNVTNNYHEYNTVFGIYLSNSRNNTISGNNVTNNYLGIRTHNSSNNTISGNLLNNDGISLSDSENSTISRNTIYYGDFGNGIGLHNSGSPSSLVGGNNITENIMIGCGLIISGPSYIEKSFHDIDTTNLVNGKPLYYYTNEVNLEADNFTNAGQVILVNCHNSLISNLNVSNGGRILFFNCDGNIISGNIVNNAYGNGIYLDGRNNTITGNTAENNNIGIFLDGDFNTVSENIANGNKENGIYIECFSDYNNIIGNTLSNNGNGLYAYICYNNNISGNVATYNNENGIYLFGRRNMILGNTLTHNYNGIYLHSESDYNNIIGNIANHNTRTGICLIYGHDNNISKNTANYNQYGIGVYSIYGYGSRNNLISENTANNNTFVGIHLVGSNHNTVSGNTLIGNGECIVEENCQGNTFSDNGDCTYGQGNGGIPIELIVVISVISGGAVIGIATLLLIRRKRKRIE